MLHQRISPSSSVTTTGRTTNNGVNKRLNRFDAVEPSLKRRDDPFSSVDRLLLLLTLLLLFLTTLLDPTRCDSIDVFTTNVGSLDGGNEPRSERAAPAKDSDLHIDIVSIGSKERPAYHSVQQEAYAHHKAVRTFLTVTEQDDTDPSCLGAVNVSMVYDICHRPSTYRHLALMKRHFANRIWLLEKHAHPEGWLCAQKRPLDGLQRWWRDLSSQPDTGPFRGNQTNQDQVHARQLFPDYLFVMDDDTWINLDTLLPHLIQHHPSDQAHVATGCLFRSPKDDRYSFYGGGFGLFLTRVVLERLTTQLYCKNDSHTERLYPNHQESDTSDFFSTAHDNYADFAAFACHQVERNQIGEAFFFRHGMSLLDLMVAYSTQQPYSLADDWNPAATFCMHSDTFISYFLQYYHVGNHARRHMSDNPLERMTGVAGSTKVRIDNNDSRPPVYAVLGQCQHLSDATCPVKNAHVCHYLTPTRMKELSNVQKQNYPESFIKE